MAQVITLAGERLFALKAQNNQQLDIDTFIFAYVPGQDSTAPIDRNEGLPPVNQRVHTQIVQQYGMINENAVVYSSVLDSLTGPFQFNWVGLYSAVNQTLIAIQHIPTVSKTVTEPGASGNILNRNFVIEYSGIAELTGITVDPATWQLDYTARLNGMDELTRQLAADMNGKDWFIDDGFKVVPRSTLNTFKVTAGVGYVSGLRVELTADHILTLSSYPQFVYVDAWFEATSDSIWKGKVAFTVTNTEMDDYIDVNGRNHYVFKLARITAADVVEDLRNVDGLAQKIDKHIQETTSAHKASAISLAVKSILGNANFTLEDVSKSYGVFVEEFRHDNESDSEVINKALAYIGGLPFSGTRLIFENGRRYTYDSTHSLGFINNLTIDLNGATLKRANGTTTATTLANDIGIGQSFITLTSIPNNWEVGDFLMAFTDNTDTNTSRNPVKITGIDRVNKTVSMINGFDVFGTFTTIIPAGTTVAKNFQCFSGRPSFGEIPMTAGLNKKISIINGTIDGNRANQLNNSWVFISEILLHSIGGIISNNEFKEIAAETIVGHGICVKDNTFININGSCFHTSIHASQAESPIFSYFTNNTCKFTNLSRNSVNGHSEGLVTFSWGAGNLIISDNICKEGSEGFLGTFGSPTEENPDSLLIVSGNIAEGFERIGLFADDAFGVIIDNNIWSNCGNNSEMVMSLKKNPACHFGDSNVGIIGTILNNISKSERLATMSDFKNYSGNVKNYVQKVPIQTTLSYTIDQVSLIEDKDAAIQAFLCGESGIAGSVYYVEGGNPFGDYVSTFNYETRTYRQAFNGSYGRQEFGRDYNSTQLVLDEDGEVQLTDFKALYLGDKNQDGSWRFIRSGNDLLMQIRNSGEYVTRETVIG